MARRLGPQRHNPQCQLGQVLTLNRVTKHANGEGRPVHGEDKACLLPQLTASLRGQGHRPDHSAQDTGRGRRHGRTWHSRACVLPLCRSVGRFWG